MSNDLLELDQAVRAAMPGADDATVRIVGAVSGLLATVAYSDSESSQDEMTHIRQELSRVDGMNEDRVYAIMAVLDKNIVELANNFAQRFTRTLVEDTTTAMRLQVLDIMLGVAAADGTITHDEIVKLRNLTTAMGLDQSQYNQLQQKYSEFLHFK